MRLTMLSLLLMGATFTVPAWAQSGAVPPVSPSESSSALEPAAAAALTRMGAYLRTLKRFEVRSDATIDVVLADNQKLQLGMRTIYLVNAPTQMRVDVETDRRHRRILYDGQALTFTAPVSRQYLSVPVTGTIAEVVIAASDRFGVDFPLQDLFRWGDASQNTAQPYAGFKVGDVRLGDEEAEHFAYRQEGGVDFQLWLAKDNPLPRKLVITDSSVPAQPQMTATFTWNLQPQLAASDFAFTPGAGWQRVEISAPQGR